jgi:hypothetical protein
MFVRIIKGSEGAWWEHRIGEVFEVREPSYSEKLFSDTHYMLVKNTTGNPMAHAISKSDCVDIDADYKTNKNASILLDKE